MVRVRSFNLASVDPADRRTALRAQVLAWAPFDDSDWRIAMRGDMAVAVAWDRRKVAAALAAAGAPGDARVVPEIWAREPPRADGARVVETLEGVDAQFWQHGTLVASRWWPERPSADEANQWLRTLGPAATGVDGLPATSNPPWLRRASDQLFGVDDLLSNTTRLERIAVGAASATLVAFSAAQAHQLYAAHDRLALTRAQLERVSTDAGALLATRQRAQALAREAHALSTAVSGVAPLDVLRHLADVLPSGAGVLKEFDLSGRKLRIAIELPPQVPRSSVVRDLQAGGWFTQVAEATDNANRGLTLFDIELTGPTAPAGTPRPRADEVPAPPREVPAPAAPLAPMQEPPRPAPRAAPVQDAARPAVPAAPQAVTDVGEPRKPPADPGIDAPRPRRRSLPDAAERTE